jgi:hypothetical protein
MQTSSQDPQVSDSLNTMVNPPTRLLSLKTKRQQGSSYTPDFFYPRFHLPLYWHSFQSLQSVNSPHKRNDRRGASRDDSLGCIFIIACTIPNCLNSG